MACRYAVLWQWRELFVALVSSELRLRYKGSTLGMAWSLAHPLALAAVYVIALKYFIRIRMDNYAMFLLAGLLPWIFFSTSLNSAVTSIAMRGHLIKKLAFPREVLPLAGVLSQLLHFSVGYLVVVPAFAIYQIGISAAYLAVPLVIIFMVFFTSGVALTVSTLQVYYRDTQHLLNVVLQLWFWVTPILYSLQMVPERFHPLLFANPLTLFMVTCQDIVVGREFPDVVRLLILLAMGMSSWFVGYAVFLKGERRIAEYV
jgi:ABC-type polysaccharide/polyol phosphate export permease